MEDEAFERFKGEMHDVFRRIRRGHHVPPERLGDLTSGESMVVMAIARAAQRGCAVRPGMVAHLAGTTPSALSQMLKSLERKGYVVRERLGGDARGIALGLTDAGAALAREGERLRDAYLKELFAYLGEDDVRDLVRVIRRMAEFFEGKQAEVAAANADAEAAAAAAESPTGANGASEPRAHAANAEAALEPHAQAAGAPAFAHRTQTKGGDAPCA